MIRRHGFRAMGTDVELLLEAHEADGAEAALADAQREFDRLEQLLSRFLPDSELSAVNAAGGGRCGPELEEVARLALDGRAATDGRFDPTVHDALVHAGYDRSFELVAPDGPAVALAPARCGGAVSIRPGWIDLPPAVRLDLGGIGKGYAADRVCRALAATGPCLVNAGGDIASAGRPWPVGVETAAGTITLLLAGALATSGRDRRRWRRGGTERHHLIDPRTGEPAQTDLVRVTVVAESAAEAEVWSTALFLAGAEAAACEADERSLPAVLVTDDGRTLLCGGLA